MAATVLNSPRVVQVSVYVVRAFVQLRRVPGQEPQLLSAGITGCDETESTKPLDLNARRGKNGVMQAVLPPTGRLTR